MPPKSIPQRRSVPKAALRIPKRERARRRRGLKKKWGLTRREIGRIGSLAREEVVAGLPIYDLRWFLREVEQEMSRPYFPQEKPRAHPKFPVSTRRPKKKRTNP